MMYALSISKVHAVLCLALVLCLSTLASGQTAPRYNITIVVPDKAEALRTIADRFEKENPDYVVTIVHPGWGGLFGTISNAFSSSAPAYGALEDGTQIDLMQIGSTWMGSFVLKLKCLEPMTKYLAQWSTEREGGLLELDFAARTEYDFRINKEWYAVPFWLDARPTFYRKDMYRAALGHDRAPDTLEELRDNGIKIADYYAARGRNVAGWAVPYHGPPAEALQGFVSQYLSDGASILTAEGECGMTTDTFKDSLRTYMNYRHDPNPALRTNRHLDNRTSGEYMDDMCNDELAAMVNGAWFYWQALGCDFGGSAERVAQNLGMIIPPKGKARRATFFGGSGMGISSASKQKDAAFKFMQYLLDPEKPNLLEFMGSDITAFSSTLNSVSESELPPPTLAMKRNLPHAYPQTFPTADFPEMGAVEDAYVIQQMIQDIHDDPSILSDNARFDAMITQSCAAMMKEIRDVQIASGRLVINDGLSTGAKVGLGVGLSVLAIVLIVLAIVWFQQKKTSNKEMEVYKLQIQEMEEDKKAAQIPFEELEFNKRIGEGAYGEVWSGYLHKTPVAIKKLKVSALTPENLNEFESEAVLMAKLRHPNCVLFMGAVVEPKHMCIVTELMTYGSLYNVLHMKDMYLDQAMKLSFAHDAVLGMAYLHSKGMVHRDLKSLNLLVDDKMNLKVSDFGLTVLKKQAQQLTSNPSDSTINVEDIDMSTTMAPAPPGSLYWMAPEVLDGAEPTEKSDVYAFAIVMWELESRCDPYNGMNPVAVAHQVATNGLRPEIPPKTHPIIRQIMEKCWATNPDDRPTFAEVENMLPSVAGASMMGLSSSTAAAKRLHGPLGEVTLVFTDVQNSTALWEAHPTAMRDALSVHNQTLRQILRQNNGYEVKTEGDAFMIAFDTPHEAVNFCMKAQVALLKAEWPNEIIASSHCPEEHGQNGKPVFRGLRVRMGIHTGEPQCQPDPVTRRMDYFGTVVNRAARVSGKAVGGQVMVSDLAYQKIKDDHEEYSFHAYNMGALQLKGIAEPEQMYSLIPSSLTDRSPKFTTGINSSMATGNTQSIMPHLNSNHNNKPKAEGGWTHNDTNAQTITHFMDSTWAIPWSDLTQGQLVGVGTFGEVFRGRFRDNDVAIKKMLQQNLKEETQLAFQAEAVLLMSLRHPNILTFMGICFESPNMSIVTELLDQSLNQAMKIMTPGLALTWRERIDIMLGAAKAMAYLHSNKPPILHRDLKSHNLLVDKSKQVRVCDFGFSALKNANRTMTTVGTAAWMAPEIILGKEYGPEADVYSYGIILWEVMARCEPFRNQSAINTARAVSKGERPSLVNTVPGDCPAGYTDLMRKCWDPKPENRPSFKEIVPVLEGISKLC